MAMKSARKGPKKSAVSKTPRKAPARAAAGDAQPAASEIASTPIVGIGASAGGLEAFTKLLEALPADTGLAFVLVQHLEPKHESALATLLTKATQMPVVEVRERMRIEPNHVYVIPSNTDLSLRDGLLHVVGRKAPSGRHLPIDYFLRSLAETFGSRALGVVMSGTASDGSAGIQAIKQQGGITFAQEPESARFDGMPRSAIATGCVDFVLPPERIARELARIARHPFVGFPSLHAIPELPASEDEWARLFGFLRVSTGVDFSLYKKPTIKRRMARRMAVTRAETLGAYQKILERDRTEVDALFEELLILVTEFFRDPKVFLLLREKIFPQILKTRPAGEPIRIWSAGCSNGQEVYSLAIALLEYLGNKGSGRSIQIFGTDVSDKALEKARIGLYHSNEVLGVSPQRLQRFFHKVNGDYQIDDSVRELCVFARHDLIHDPPFSRIDLLSCRNVLIYFEPLLQRRALTAFHYALKNNGVLLLGKTESLAAHEELFTLVDRQLKFFRKNAAVHLSFSVPQQYHDAAVPARQTLEVQPGIDLEREADQAVWERSAYAGLVVNDELQILHFRGDTSAYVRPAPGRASLQLMRILRQELTLEVRSLLQKARRTGKIARSEGIEVHHKDRADLVNMEVCPLARSGPGNSFLILFEPAAGASPSRSRGGRARAGKRPAESQEMLRLRAELVRTREYVQSIIRDQETTNEDLKAANEEALSSTEELQSANEELATAKEELQSSNEELFTLNEQLQHRNNELSLLSSDLSNVLTGIDIPIVILGPDRRIRRFTPPAENLLGLISGDIGRPIGTLRLGIPVPDLDDLLSTVVERGKEVSREMQTESGRWFLLRIRPFRAAGDRVEGLLMAFVDIHKMKLREHLQKDRNLISAILDAAKTLLVAVFDPEGRIMRFNRGCQELTGYSQAEVQGRSVWEFLLAPHDVEPVKSSFREIADGKSIQFEGYWLTKDGGRVLISWSISPVILNGRLDSVITTGVNVTAPARP